MASSRKLTIGVAILTLQSERYLSRCLPPFLNSPLKPRVLVVDSSSTDATVATAKSLGAETTVILRKDFNHGASRELARKLLDTDIVVMVTPDAFAIDEHVLEKLVEPILQKQAAVTYARQIPHEGAKFLEAFPREFNYPNKSYTRSLLDVEQYGAHTFFCSDSCAAYLNEALDKIGGFQPILFGEDTIAVAKLLNHSYKISYVAEAVVRHSHSYSLSQEFCRHFDIGLIRTQYSTLLLTKGNDNDRGKTYVRTILNRLLNEKPALIPYAFLQTLVKWMGYRIGQLSLKAPVWFKKAFSSQHYYWTSASYLQHSKNNAHL